MVNNLLKKTCETILDTLITILLIGGGICVVLAGVVALWPDASHAVRFVLGGSAAVLIGLILIGFGSLFFSD